MRTDQHLHNPLATSPNLVAGTPAVKSVRSRSSLLDPMGAKMGRESFTFAGVVVKQGKSYTSICLKLDVASQGRTIRQARNALAEATALYLDSAIESNLPYLRPVPKEEDPRRVNPRQIVATFPVKVDIAINAHA